MIPTLDLVLDYLALNPDRYLFPISAGKKAPPCFDDNLNLASNDPDQVTKWHKRYPGCEWGFSLAKSGYIVVDVDMKDGRVGKQTYDEIAKKHKWPPTETVMTPSGGLHYYYKVEPGKKHVFALGKNGFGEDVDSPNYVLIAGCKLADGGEYKDVPSASLKPVPQWFYEFLKEREKPAANETNAVIDLDQDANVKWAIDYLNNDAPCSVEGSGGEATTLKVAMVLRDRGISENMARVLMAEHYNKWPTCDPEWEIDGLDGLDKKIANAYAYASLSAPGGDTAENDFADAPLPAVVRHSSDTTPDGVTPAADGSIPPAAPGKRVKATVELKDLCEEWVWIGGQERFVRRDDGTMWKSSAFDSMFNFTVQRGNVSKTMFGSRVSIRRFDSMVFRPGMPEFTSDHLYNTWRQSKVVPVQGDTTVWDDHLVYLFPDQSDRDHVLNWMAWVYRNQGLKPNHALLIVGETHGTGKSYLARVLEQLIGATNTKRPKNSSLKGDFNAWAAQCKLAIIEELMQIGRREVANELRDIITEPTIEVNMKNVSAFQIENYMAMMAISNHPDALPLEDSDRRWLVVATHAVKRDFDYYHRLFTIFDSPEMLSAVAYQLQNRNLGTYDALLSAPLTKAKAHMIESGRSDLDAWLFENTGNPPMNGRIMAVQDVLDILPKRLERTPRINNVITSFIRRNLKAVDLGQQRTDMGRYRLWAINGSAIDKIAGDTVGAIYSKDRAAWGAGKAIKGSAEDDFGAG